jgi:hypothetical protein
MEKVEIPHLRPRFSHAMMEALYLGTPQLKTWRMGAMMDVLFLGNPPLHAWMLEPMTYESLTRWLPTELSSSL